ncbi:MAG: hypothetical protein QOF03_524 [Alphaproteobacteria bacterium]|jgi:hypothetical protein|nr:hypothetical protein [Alphaproteobacteria bacterium]
MRELKLLHLTWVWTCALCALCPVGQAVSAPSSLAGWNQYKFDMTPEQVKAVPGIAWNPLKLGTVPLTPSEKENGRISWGFMSASSKVTLYGHAFGVTASFDPKLTLNDIAARTDGDGSSLDDCEQQFRMLVEAFELDYGPFTPVQSTGGRDLRRATETTVWRAIAGAKSKYEFDTLHDADGSDSFVARANRTYGAHVIGIGMSYDSSLKDNSLVAAIVGSRGCSLAFNFSR